MIKTTCAPISKDLSITCAIPSYHKTWLLQHIIDGWSFPEFSRILSAMEDLKYISYREKIDWLAKYDKPHHLQLALAQAIDEADTIEMAAYHD